MDDKPMIYLMGTDWTDWHALAREALGSGFSVPPTRPSPSHARAAIRCARAVLHYRIHPNEESGALIQFAHERGVPVVVLAPRMHGLSDLARFSPGVANLVDSVFPTLPEAAAYMQRTFLPQGVKLHYDARTGEVASTTPVGASRKINKGAAEIPSALTRMNPPGRTRLADILKSTPFITL